MKSVTEETKMEVFAEIAHEIWSHWMKYQKTKGYWREVGFLLAHDDMRRWERQMNTLYSNLTEEEKKSDREIAKDIIQSILNKHNLSVEDKIGATNDYPEGKMTGDDEGGLKMRVGIKDNRVIVDFGKDVTWLGLDSKGAIELGNILIDRANQIKKSIN
jgi:hypothetical protein